MVRDLGRVVWFSLKSNKAKNIVGEGGFDSKNIILRGYKGHLLYSLSMMFLSLMD